MKILALAIALALLPSISAADRVTVDPNTQKAAPPASEPPDERLAKPLTYTATGKRLHTIIEEISAQTGVTINCGSSKDDWKVRDLPVVVCAKDLPLGKLLRGIADCTHLLLTSSKVDGVKRYRIWRDSVREKTITNYLRERDESTRDRAEYEWDTITKLGSMPDSEIKVDQKEFKEHGGVSFARVMDFARIMASLPADAKERAFAGERIKVKAKDLPPQLALSMQNLYRSSWEEDQQSRVDTQHRLGNAAEPKPVPQSDLDNVMLTFYVTQGDWQVFRSKLGTSRGYGTDPAVNANCYLVSAAIPGWPRPPTPVEEPKYAFDEDVSSLSEAGVYLNDKIKAKKPDLKRDIVFSDRVAAVSDASGYSIICEDFISYQERMPDDNGLFDRELDLHQAVQSAGHSIQWYLDKNSKLLMGANWGWCERHDRLVPESFIKGLLAKLEGDGVDLDDAVTICGLTSGQYYDWIMDKRDLGWIAWAAGRREEPFWKLYNSLSAHDKQTAKSKDGLPLAKFDPYYLAAYFAEAAEGARQADRESDNPLVSIFSAANDNPETMERVSRWVMQAHRDLAAENAEIDYDQLAAELREAFPGLASASSIPTDPAVISTLTLRINKLDRKPSVRISETKDGVQTTRWEDVDNGIKRCQYSMSIEGPGVNLQMGGPILTFPVYSDKREAEVYKELQAKSKAER